MATTRQTSFLGGEFSPLLWGRTDLENYAHGLRRCRNFFVTKQGAAMSRPGTRYVGEYKVSLSEPARLIPFVFSDSTSYVLEVTQGYIRFHQNGATVQSGGSPYVIAAPWLLELRKLQFLQSGNTIYFTHPGHPPQQLVRRGHTDWVLSEINFFVPPFPGAGDVYTPEPVWVERDIATRPPDVTMPFREWYYRVTYVIRGTDGVVRETQDLPIFQRTRNPNPTDYTALWDRVALPRKVQIHPDWPGLIYVGLRAYSSDIVEARIYRGRGGVYGLVGIVRPPGNVIDGAVWEDTGDEPDYTRQPPQQTNPLGPQGTPQQGRANSVAFFEQRLVFGGSTEAPEKVFLSRTDDYFNFDRVRPTPPADGATGFELASRKREEIRAVVGMDRLLVFTESSVWAAEGVDGPIDAAGLVGARPQFDIGSTWTQPLVVGNRVLWARSKGSGIRDLNYDWQIRGYAGNDLSLASEHLFRDAKIADWTYAEDPFGIVWVVREDGTLLSLTYGDGAATWARHDTDGKFVAVCSVPEGDEDAVYVAVERNGKGYVERFASRKDGMCLDAGRTQTFPAPGATAAVTGLGHLNGRTDVYAVVAGRVQGPFTVGGGQITVQVPADAQGKPTAAHAGLRFTPELETLDTAMERDRMKVIRKVIWEVDASQGLWTGERFDRLTEWKQRTAGTGYSAVGQTTGRAEVLISTSWNVEGRVVLRQVDPLPVTVLGVTREGDLGGR